MSIKKIIYNIFYLIITCVFYVNGWYSNYFKIKKYIINFSDLKYYERVIIISEYHSVFFNKKIEKLIWFGKYIVYIGTNLLINFFVKNKLKFAIVKNITSNEFELIMQNESIKEIYFFGHGQKYGVILKSKFYMFKRLKRLKINTKNIICQLSCGGKKKMVKDDISIALFSKKYYGYSENMCFFENWWWLKRYFNNFYFSNNKK